MACQCLVLNYILSHKKCVKLSHWHSNKVFNILCSVEERDLLHMILTADYLLKITRHTCKDKVLPGAPWPHGFVAVILNSHKRFLQLIFSCTLYVVLPTQSSTTHLLGHKWCLIRGYFCRKFCLIHVLTLLHYLLLLFITKSYKWKWKSALYHVLCWVGTVVNCFYSVKKVAIPLSYLYPHCVCFSSSFTFSRRYVFSWKHWHESEPGEPVFCFSFACVNTLNKVKVNK